MAERDSPSSLSKLRQPDSGFFKLMKGGFILLLIWFVLTREIEVVWFNLTSLGIAKSYAKLMGYLFQR